MTEKIFLKCSDAMINEINSFLAEQNSTNDEKEKYLSENLRITLNMIREGLSLIEICERRNLSDTIISEHIITLLENSYDIDITQVIPEEHIKLIENAIANSKTNLLPEIKSKLPEEITYAEIRIYLSHKKKLSQKNLTEG
jgi:ATP-dependent DNA helicase RecQ